METGHTYIYNHADKHFSVNSFSSWRWKNEPSLMHPFLGEYDATTDIETCSGDTVCTLDQREVFILVFGQWLLFGGFM